MRVRISAVDVPMHTLLTTTPRHGTRVAIIIPCHDLVASVWEHPPHRFEPLSLLLRIFSSMQSR